MWLYMGECAMSVQDFVRGMRPSAASSLDETIQTARQLSREIQICMFASGVGSISALQKTPLIEVD
jgi:isopentenyl diphosphate isomerase/L-lactate dehydrogenase-like FMN-dependent dehydrogenase